MVVNGLVIKEEVVEEEVQEEAVVEEQPEVKEETVNEEDDEIVSVSIGDEPPPEPSEEDGKPAPGWVKDLRKRNRELDRELREAKRKLQEAPQAKPEVEVGPKPTLESFNYDTDKYDDALTKWYEHKKKADEKAAEAKKAAEEADKAWQDRLKVYQDAKVNFKADDFEEAEAEVLQLLDVTQQGIIVHGANDPTLVVYALGKNVSKAKEVAAIKDPVRFAFAVAKLEAQLKVTTKKPATQPEKIVSGNGRPSGSIDQTLERLRQDAAKTGDYTKVAAYKRAKKG